MAKIRQGFVSNSSSTSFYIDAKKYNKHDVEYVIEKLIEVCNRVEKENKTITDMCEVYESSNLEYVWEQIIEDNYDYYKMSDKNKEIYKKGMLQEFKETWPKEVIVVDSVNDNSIDYSIQEFLENKFDAIRKHWG